MFVYAMHYHQHQNRRKSNGEVREIIINNREEKNEREILPRKPLTFHHYSFCHSFWSLLRDEMKNKNIFQYKKN